jgi:phosphoserine phosphatase
MGRNSASMEDNRTEATYEMIDAVEAELEKIKAQRAKLQDDCRTWVERRNSLNGELKELSEKIRNIKNERDAVNSDVKTLKESRDKIRAEITEKRNKIGLILIPFKEIRSQVEGTFDQTKNSFDELEWKLQTSSLDPKEENRLLKQVKELELRLVKHQRANELKAIMTEHRTAIETLKLSAQSIHQKILETAEASARLHEEMMQLVTQLKGIKTAADEAHKKYIEARNESEQLEQELVRRVLERKKLRSEILGDEESERLKKRKEFADRLAQSGSAKLSQGKRLSLEEFKAMMEQNKI